MMREGVRLQLDLGWEIPAGLIVNLRPVNMGQS